MLEKYLYGLSYRPQSYSIICCVIIAANEDEAMTKALEITESSNIVNLEPLDFDDDGVAHVGGYFE